MTEKSKSELQREESKSPAHELDKHKPTEGDADQSDEQQSDEKQRSHPLEIAVSRTSAVIIIAIIGFLLYEGFSSKTPPILEAAANPAEKRGSLYYLPIVLMNRGKQSAQTVQVRVELSQPGRHEPVDEATVEFDWSPAQSRRKGTATLRENPADYVTSLEIQGYTEP